MMLDTASGVEAFIKPFGSDQPYKEYAVPPDTFKEGPKTNPRYIEAVTNQRYSIAIRIPIDFDLMGFSALKITCGVYAGEVISWNTLSETWIICPQTIENLQAGTGPVILEVDSFVAKQHSDRRSYGFRFGESGVLEQDQTLPKETETRHMNYRGRIFVRISRGRCSEEETKSSITSLDLGVVIKNIKTSRKVAIDNGRSHILKFVSCNP